MKYGVKVALAAERVETLGWFGFAVLDFRLRHAVRRDLGWTGLGWWVFRRADYDLLMDSWVVCFEVWPPGWGECSTCKGSGTSWDPETGGKCWDCRGGGVLPVADFRPVRDVPDLNVW